MIKQLTTTRYGRFKITFDQINNQREKIQKAFNSLIIVQAEANFPLNAIVYIAVGDIFEEIHEGERIPDYNLSVVDGKLQAKKVVS